MVLAVVGDDGCVEILLQTSHAVHRALHSGCCPEACECLRIAVERTPAAGEAVGGKGMGMLPMKASVSRITGVMCSMAILAASNAMWKQSVGLAAATTQSGDSPLRP